VTVLNKIRLYYQMNSHAGKSCAWGGAKDFYSASVSALLSAQVTAFVFVFLFGDAESSSA
jgi:hypothetical protein